jgi:hypothetical protein
MSRGHGAPGLLDNLRTVIDLADDSAASRRPYLDFSPGAGMTAGGWHQVDSTSRTYVQRAHYVLDGVVRDIVGVDTDLGALTRVDTLADCQATAGTYYCNIEAAVSATSYFDDGFSLWDSGGQFWDFFPPLDLYVHLQGDADPNGITVVALLGFFFGTRGEVHPSLGPDKLTNGGFESLTGWAESLSGAGFSSAQDTVLFYGPGSTASLKLVSTGAAVGNATRLQDVATVAGVIYRLAGYYLTDSAFGATLSARLLLGNVAGTLMLYPDGRDSDGSGLVDLTPTGGEWRRFLFDFLAPAGATTRIQLRLKSTGSGSAGQFNLDGVTLRRVYRYSFYEPRLAADALQDVTVGADSIFFDDKPVGIASLSLLNGDAVLEPIFGQLLTSSKPARITVGGALEDGQEIYRDEFTAEAYALSRDLWAEDARISIDLDDPMTMLLDLELPLRRYGLGDFPNLFPDRAGQSRPLLFGSHSGALTLGTVQGPGLDGLPPIRIDLAATGYGIYEIADTTGTPGLAGDVHVYLYWTAQLRDDVAPPATELAAGTDYSFDMATGRLTILRNVKDFSVDAAGIRLGYATGDFNIGAGTLTPGAASASSAEAQAALLTSSWTAAAGVAITWTYSTVTHKFTVSKAAGTLNLLTKTGNALSQAWWERMGFDSTADKTGALSYASDRAIFTSPENDHFFHILARGFADDAAGTYTGTPNACMVESGDIFYFLMRVYAGATVDAASIVSARSNYYASQGCRLYLSSPMKVRDALTQLAIAGLADIVVDGSGTWFFKPYVSAAGTDAVSFTDRDYLTFRLGRRVEDVYKNVELSFGIKPLKSELQNKIFTEDLGVKTKFGRAETLRMATARRVEDTGLADLGRALARLSSAGARLVEFSSRGKLVGVQPGRKVLISRTRALDASGQLQNVTFRVLSLRRALLSGVTTCVAVEDTAFAAPLA